MTVSHNFLKGMAVMEVFTYSCALNLSFSSHPFLPFTCSSTLPFHFTEGCSLALIKFSTNSVLYF